MKHRLEKSHGLTEAQLTAIHQLEAICNQADGLTMKLNPNRLRRRSKEEVNDFLYYDDNHLIGYLALYVFNSQEAEVGAMTHPDYRRQGVFKQLLAAARDELKRRQLPDFLFICEKASRTALPCMQAIGAQYDFSEYKMILKKPSRFETTVSELQLKSAQPDDIDDLARMDQICFDVSLTTARNWLSESLANPERSIWVATLGSTKIGKIQISTTDTETFINAFCVLPEYRGRGYGKTILGRLVEQLVAEHHPLIALEVACDNEQALSLYQNCGFETVTAYDYYRLAVNE